MSVTIPIFTRAAVAVLASIGRSGVSAGSLPVLAAAATRLGAGAVESPLGPVAVH